MYLKTSLATRNFAGVFNASSDIQAIRIGIRIANAPIQIGSNFANETAAQNDARIQIAIISVSVHGSAMLVTVNNISGVTYMSNIHIKTDANVFQLFQQFASIDVGCVGGQKKEIIIV